MLRWHWGLTLRRCIELHWSDTHLQQTGLGWWDKIWSKSLFNNDDQIVSIHTELTETIAVWLDPLGGVFIHPGLQSPLFSVDMNFLAHFFHVKQWNAILCYISFSLSFFCYFPLFYSPYLPHTACSSSCLHLNLYISFSLLLTLLSAFSLPRSLSLLEPTLYPPLAPHWFSLPTLFLLLLLPSLHTLILHLQDTGYI